MGIDDCPQCGSKMEKGLLISREFYWSDKPRKNVFAYGRWHIFSEGVEFIAKRSWSSLANVEAYRCKNCRIATFKY